MKKLLFFLTLASAEMPQVVHSASDPMTAVFSSDETRASSSSGATEKDSESAQKDYSAENTALLSVAFADSKKRSDAEGRCAKSFREFDQKFRHGNRERFSFCSESEIGAGVERVLVIVHAYPCHVGQFWIRTRTPEYAFSSEAIKALTHPLTMCCLLTIPLCFASFDTCPILMPEHSKKSHGVFIGFAYVFPDGTVAFDDGTATDENLSLYCHKPIWHDRGNYPAMYFNAPDSCITQ